VKANCNNIPFTSVICQEELPPSRPGYPASLGCCMDPHFGNAQGNTVFRYVE